MAPAFTKQFASVLLKVRQQLAAFHGRKSSSCGGLVNVLSSGHVQRTGRCLGYERFSHHSASAGFAGGEPAVGGEDESERFLQVVAGFSKGAPLGVYAGDFFDVSDVPPSPLLNHSGKRCRLAVSAVHLDFKCSTQQKQIPRLRSRDSAGQARNDEL